MANFNTHFTVATTVSGLVAGSLLLTNLATPKSCILYWLIGSFGGILPDIDSPRSIPARIVFNGLALLLASFSVWTQIDHPNFSLFHFIFLWIAVFIPARYVLIYSFKKLTVHRGNFHSILAILFVGFLTTAFCYHGLHIRAFVAWGCGFFMSLGYFVHLSLDELYSVDVSNRKLKKSFGTALKIASLRYKLGSLLLLCATVSAYYYTPSTEDVTKILTHSQTYQKIQNKLFID